MRMLIKGNCLDYISNVSSDAFFISDPPYNQGYHYDTYGDCMRADEYKKLLVEVFGGRKAVIILYPEETINLLGGGALGQAAQVVSWVTTVRLTANEPSVGI